MERRSYSRKYLRLKIKVEIPAKRTPIGACLLDISRKGAFIEMPALLPASAPLIVEFRLPDGRPQNIFRLYAKVIRRTASGIGVSFLNMPAATSHALDAAIGRLPPGAEEAASDSEPTQGFAAVWAV
ncbi:MAG TPA: PilZ domain-containing protein [Gammaproteobacteria bacterium]|nr:PilZ domain-containing protein [Gammaproteobacteria bacterium]